MNGQVPSTAHRQTSCGLHCQVISVKARMLRGPGWRQRLHLGTDPWLIVGISGGWGVARGVSGVIPAPGPKENIDSIVMHILRVLLLTATSSFSSCGPRTMRLALQAARTWLLSSSPRRRLVHGKLVGNKSGTALRIFFFFPDAALEATIGIFK